MKSGITMLVLIFSFHVLATPKEKAQIVEIKVSEKGFEPGQIEAMPGSQVILHVTRITENTCAKKIKISSRNVKQDLPLNKTVSIDLGRLEKGDITFACGMDMLTGHIIVK